MLKSVTCSYIQPRRKAAAHLIAGDSHHLSVLFYKTIAIDTVGMYFSRKLVQPMLCVCWWGFQWQPERKGKDLTPGLCRHVMQCCYVCCCRGRVLLEHTMATMACSGVQEGG